MMPSIRHILTSNPLRRLHHDRSGTAMTEFAITLPVYVMFMVGIITLYEIHQGAMLSEQQAAAEMWDEALDVQHREYLPGMEGLPMTGAANAVMYYNEADDLNTLAAGIDTGTAAGGMYADSGLKANFANSIGAGGIDLDCPESPQMHISQIVDGQSHTARLMNDMVDFNAGGGDSGPIMAAAGAILDGTGSRPMLGAGIRYGIVGGVHSEEFGSDHDLYSRAYQAETLTAYNASAPTRPMERIFQLALVRLEIGTESAYEDTVAFGLSNIGSGISNVSGCP